MVIFAFPPSRPVFSSFSTLLFAFRKRCFSLREEAVSSGMERGPSPSVYPLIPFGSTERKTGFKMDPRVEMVLTPNLPSFPGSFSPRAFL